MKRHHAFLILILICASSAYAQQSVTPVLDQEFQEVARNPEMAQACGLHFKALGDRKNAMSTIKNEQCGKVVDALYDAIKTGAEACSVSFDPLVRSEMKKSVDDIIEKTQGMHCTYSEAAADPCPQCKGTMSAVLRVVTHMSTERIDNSLSYYQGLFPKLQSVASQNSCSLDSVLQASKVQNLIAGLEDELKHAQIDEVRFRKGPVPARADVKLPGKEVRLSDPTTIAKYHNELPPIQVGTGSTPAPTGGDGSVTTASKDPKSKDPSQDSSQDPSMIGSIGSTGSKGSTGSSDSTSSNAPSRSPSLPSGLTLAGRLSNGGIGFTYCDPAQAGKCFMGYQTKDPNTGRIDSYAYPISAETAANAKNNPANFEQILSEAQASASSHHFSDQDALNQGKALFTSLSKAPGNTSSETPIKASPGSNEGSPVSSDTQTVGEVKPSSGIDKGSLGNSLLGAGVETAATLKPNKGQDSTQNVSTAEEDPSDGTDSQPSAKTDSQTDSKTAATAKHSQKATPGTKKTSRKPSKKPAKNSTNKHSQKHSQKHSKKSASEKPADYSEVYYTPEGAGKVRYFLVNKPPRPAYVGRMVQANGKTEFLYYDLSANADQLKEMSHNPEKLKSAFEARRHANGSEPHSWITNRYLDEPMIEDTLLNQAIKH